MQTHLVEDLALNTLEEIGRVMSNKIDLILHGGGDKNDAYAMTAIVLGALVEDFNRSGLNEVLESPEVKRMYDKINNRQKEKIKKMQEEQEAKINELEEKLKQALLRNFNTE